MYIHSVKLVNFKSIGDYPESEIILEPNVTAIIGKNESGKSNVLEGLSKINFEIYGQQRSWRRVKAEAFPLIEEQLALPDGWA